MCIYLLRYTLHNKKILSGYQWLKSLTARKSIIDLFELNCIIDLFELNCILSAYQKIGIQNVS